ncbi:3-oxoacyl-(acyl carrier protein) synthase II [mine drainage metagenome]|uniref:3-oxoacyl-(Acyl carrier protein) synthase II n=2 Tax=mine drainage metagenome TaxID=410659 RepID=T1BFA4_9ZZZZ
MAGLTALGHDWPTIAHNLQAHRSGVRYMEEWDRYEDLNTRLAAPVVSYELPPQYNRKTMRSMGPVALMSTRATELALEDAGLLNDPVLQSGQTGIAYGACSGSADAVVAFGRMAITSSIRGITSGTYVQMMSHTGAVNISLYFGITGRIIPTSSACTSGSQAIGFAYEHLKHGKQTVMIAGGAEELSIGPSAVFDTLFATSTRNDSPHATPRPFDRDRDGLVVGEGAATLILEELEHALNRGARIYAEVVGFGCNTDGSHITQPRIETMAIVMQQALEDANIPPGAIGYVNAHGTGTDRGDIAESFATHSVFGERIPISSLKSYFGHTLGACGSLEAWLSIEMMRNNWFAPTIHLENPDPACATLDYLMGSGRNMEVEHIMSNNFAFGGINTSLIFRRWENLSQGKSVI